MGVEGFLQVLQFTIANHLALMANKQNPANNGKLISRVPEWFEFLSADNNVLVGVRASRCQFWAILGTTS